MRTPVRAAGADAAGLYAKRLLRRKAYGLLAALCALCLRALLG